MPELQNPIEKYFSKINCYHYYMFALLFSSKLPVFWHILSLIFLSPPMQYDCVTGNSSSSSRNTCPCPNPKWDRSVFTETLQTKFNILCEETWLISFSQSILYVGMLFGALIFGFLADKLGRLSMFSACCLLLAVAGCLVTLMPNIIGFIIMRFVEGIAVGGAIVTGYVFCIEFCAVNNREMITALFHIPLNISHMSLSGISYILRHCDQFQLAISLPVFIYSALYFLLAESPKWFLDTHKVNKAVSTMERIAKFNKMPHEQIRQEMQAYHDSRVSTSSGKVSICQIFKHRRLTINLICMSFVYFVCGMGYYGVSQYIGKMSGNIHINVAISGLMLLPGTITAIFLLQKLNRRTFLIATNFLSGIFMLLVVIIPKTWAWCRMLSAGICNCFYFMSFIIVFLYGVELFPTSVRNSVLGFLSFLSRVGQIAAPPINSLPEIVSGCIFGIVPILGALACYPLPETKNIDLPSSVEETQNLTKDKTPDISATRANEPKK